MVIWLLGMVSLNGSSWGEFCSSLHHLLLFSTLFSPVYDDCWMLGMVMVLNDECSHNSCLLWRVEKREKMTGKSVKGRNRRRESLEWMLYSDVRIRVEMVMNQQKEQEKKSQEDRMEGKLSFCSTEQVVEDWIQLNWVEEGMRDTHIQTFRKDEGWDERSFPLILLLLLLVVPNERTSGQKMTQDETHDEKLFWVNGWEEMRISRRVVVWC